jgi:hypothetical protein
MVSDLLVEKFEDVKAWTVANETLSGLIRDGVAA